MDNLTGTKLFRDADPIDGGGRAANVTRLPLPTRSIDTRFLTSPILTIEHVARLLGCSVAHVRAIPAPDLPRHRIAKRDLYLLDELIAYVRACGRRALGADELVQEVERAVLGSDPDSERRRPSRRATNASRS